MTKLEFWEAVYIAAIRAGKSEITAKDYADQAVKDRRLMR